MKKSWISLCLSGMVIGAIFTGCGKSADSDGKKTIGIAMPAKSLERWNRDGAYLKKEFEQEGYEVILSYSENDAEKQEKDIEKMIRKNPDALIIAPIDGEGLADVLEDVEIPVISYDRLIRNTDVVSYYISFDNYKVGELQGQYIIDSLDLGNTGKKTFNMEITAGDPGDNNAVFYYNGAVDTLKQFIDGGVIKIPSGQREYQQTGTPGWSTAQAMNRMQNILKTYYSGGENLDVALCSNDSTALGVAQAIMSGYTGKVDPLITGQDGDEENLKNILDGRQAMTVYKSLRNEVQITVSLTKEILSGEEPAAEFCDKAGKICKVKYDTESYDNGVFKVPSYLLIPEIVTKENYKEVLVDTGDYTEDENGYLEAAK